MGKGAVAAFLHAYVAGLRPTAPGYRTFEVRPRPGGGLTHASTTHTSPYGPIEVAWRRQDGATELSVSVPPGTTATVEVKEQKAGSTAYFDRSNGRLVDSTYTQKIELEIVENGMTITLKGNMEANLKLAGKEK
jgi:hypothetical protein